MVGDETRHGAAHDFLDVYSIALCHIKQQLAIDGGDRTHKRHRQLVVALILTNVSLEKSGKLSVNQRHHVVIVEMLAQKE